MPLLPTLCVCEKVDRYPDVCRYIKVVCLRNISREGDSDTMAEDSLCVTKNRKPTGINNL